MSGGLSVPRRSHVFLRSMESHKFFGAVPVGRENAK